MVCAMFDIDIEIVIVIVMSEHDGRRSEKIFSGALALNATIEQTYVYKHNV